MTSLKNSRVTYVIFASWILENERPKQKLMLLKSYAELVKVRFEAQVPNVNMEII